MFYPQVKIVFRLIDAIDFSPWRHAHFDGGLKHLQNTLETGSNAALGEKTAGLLIYIKTIFIDKLYGFVTQKLDDLC